MYDNLKECLRGINAINITPFDESNKIEWDLLGQNIENLISNGINVIYPGGNTGEFYSLTLDELKEVIKFVVKKVNGRAKVIAGVGYDYKTASHLASYAEAVGADGIMIHQPLNPYILELGLVEYYKEISNSTGLPILLYVRQETITIEVLKKVTNFSNVVGIKYAINNLVKFAKTVKEVDADVVWICGSAEMWAPFFFIAGAEGFTSGLVNVDAKRSLDLLNALKEKRFQDAMVIWNELRPFEELRAKKLNGNNVTVVKEAMRLLNLSNGLVRPPINQLSFEELDELKETLISWGHLTEPLN